MVLSVHPTNPRYFVDRNGKAIYLTGSHQWNLFHSGDGLWNHPGGSFMIKQKIIFMFIVTVIMAAVIIFPYEAGFAEQATFMHPGLLNNQAELNLIKAKVATHAEPWYTGYLQIADYRSWVPQAVENYCWDSVTAVPTFWHWIAVLPMPVLYSGL